MNAQRVMVAKAVTPERGEFLLRVPEPLEKAAALGGCAIAAFDYGLDECRIGLVREFDRAADGERIPGFRLECMVGAAERARIAENRDLADRMMNSFRKFAAVCAPGAQIRHWRLSYGRERLYIRYRRTEENFDFSAAAEAMERSLGVKCECWPAGPRDEAAALGAMGACGRRAACCACWMRRFPSGLGPELAAAAALPKKSPDANGACGRYRCCLAFETGQGGEQ